MLAKILDDGADGIRIHVAFATEWEHGTESSNTGALAKMAVPRGGYVDHCGIPMAVGPVSFRKKIQPLLVMVMYFGLKMAFQEGDSQICSMNLNLAILETHD